MTSGIMNKDFRHITIVVVLAMMFMIAGCIIGGMAGYNRGKDSFKPLQPDTIRIETIDTCWILSPPDTVTQVFTKVVKVPVYEPETEHGSDEPVTDSTWAVLTYEQHFTHIDNVCDIYHSGYDSKIDSVIAYKHHTTQIIKQPYEVFKTPRLTVDLGVGNHQWNQLDPYVFARATVTVDKWKIEPYAGYTYSQQPMFGVSVSRSIILVK